MYTEINFKSKKELKEAFAAGKDIFVYQPGGIFTSKKDGDVAIEGPHYPKAHTWYARVKIENGKIVKILG